MGRDDSVIFFMNRFQDFNLSREGGGGGGGGGGGQGSWMVLYRNVYIEREGSGGMQ